MRSTCLVLTVLIYRLWFGRSYSTKTYLSLVPVVLGVALATYGDYYFTTIGFALTLLGVVLASVKVNKSLNLVSFRQIFRSGLIFLLPADRGN